MSTADAPIMITFPFVFCYLSFFYFLYKIVLSLEIVLYLSHFEELTCPHVFKVPFICYIVSGYFFLDYYFNFDKSTAIFEPISALFITNEMFDAKLLPCVN